MVTTKKQDDDFVRNVIDTSVLLESAIDWIRDNLRPDEVFTDAVLREWALDNGFVVETEED